MATRLRLIANPVASMVAIAASQRVPQPMRSNIDAVATSLPKAVAAEWFNANLVQHAARITALQLVPLKSQTP